MRIWIDFANSPHVLFFKPMIAELESRGHEVVLTARDFAQTVPLAEKFDFDAEVIGSHGGSNLAEKSRAILDRAFDLAAWARGEKVDLAVHHNSYAQAVAARLIRVPSVALMDYEYQPANHLSFRLASKVMVPSAIPTDVLYKYGARGKLEPYDGIKEDLYVPWFPADPQIRTRLGVGNDEVLVLARPAPDMAAYHRFHNPLFDQLMWDLDGRPGVTTLLVPRTAAQRAQFATLRFEHIRVLDDVFDGIALIRAADAVITAGGTMGREAAAAGVPAYSIFQGKLGAVDRYLADAGRLTLLDGENVSNITCFPKKNQSKQDTHGDLLAHVVDGILATA